MKMILIIVVGVGLAVYGLYYYLSKYTGMFKPILPTVFFELSGDSRVIAIDFGDCAPGKATVSGDFGSIAVEVWSYDTNTCRMNYSNDDTEKKFWTRCLVPRGLNRKVFEKTYEGVDFSEISQYCKQI